MRLTKTCASVHSPRCGPVPRRRVPEVPLPACRRAAAAPGLEGVMGNFEKLSVLVIVVIILMILVVALYTWTDNPDGSSGAEKSVATADETPKPFVASLPGPVRPK